MSRAIAKTAAAAVLMVLTVAAPSLGAGVHDRMHYIAFVGDEVLSENKADVPVNPASVVKIGTSLWALETHGADYRYATAFGTTGEWDRATGVLEGDLVVLGGSDPDFQWENAFLVARELNRLGLRRVEGRLRISGTFWCGWERGVEHRLTDPVARGELMGKRLQASFDPKRWSRSALNTWKSMCERRGWDQRERPQIVITDGVAVDGPNGFEPLLVHRSNRLPDTLRRFNVYSNNDIVRIAEEIGEVAEMQAFLVRRLGAPPGSIELSTASGELRNRMTVRLMTRLYGELEREAAEHGLEVQDLLPIVGCDPGATRRMFPALAGSLAGTVTCKTGTLTDTDGGVAVVAGSFTTADGRQVVFAIAAPGAGRNLQYWRMFEQRWVMSLMAEQGGAVTVPCRRELPFSDTFAEIDVVLADDPSAE